ncbi:MAG: ComF family protein [Fastidiosipilaceae bacterium]|jgi:ComF family protein|nr:ComF family protein [Clostridiaceae bacterium]
MKSNGSFLHHGLLYVLNRYLLPATCIFCGLPLTEARYWYGANSDGICGGCRANLPFRSQTERIKKLRDFDVAKINKEIPRYLLDINVVIAFDYNADLSKCVSAFKFHDLLAAARPLGQLLSQVLVSIDLPFEPTAIVPIPLHAKRWKSRGYNQAEEMARVISVEHRLPLLPHLLRRERDTSRQSEIMDSVERLANVKEAFVADAEVVDHKVILVDDIITTGATILAAAAALFQRGCQSVVVLALAGG